MKFSAVAPFFLAATSVYATSLTSGPGYDIVKTRQAKVHRDLLDVCVSLDADLVLGADILHTVDALVAGHIDVCLCVSLIPEFIKANVVAQTAVNLVGVAKVTALIEGLINDHPDCQHCSFPEHSHSICSPSWPCEFECHDGYTAYTNPGDAHPSSCRCPAPMTECNGKCGNFPNGCGSAVPAPPQRRSRHAQVGTSKRQVVGKPLCADDKLVCGVASGSGSGWECVDPKNDKESCGGCVTPAPFGVYHPATGKDCTALPHVATVDCKAASCYITSCKPGFEPSAAHDVCISATTIEPRMFNLGPGITTIDHGKRSSVVEKHGDIAPKNADIRNLVKLGEGAGLAVKAA